MKCSLGISNFLEDICSLSHLSDQIRSDQMLSCVRLFVTPWIAAHQTSLSITNSQSSLRLTSIALAMPSSHLIPCRPLLLLPPIPPSIRVFSNESTLCLRWPKYWSFSFSIIPSKEIPGLISFRMDWLDFLAVQETCKSLLQHHSSKASILRRSAFFTVQLSHPYMTTGKTIALTRRTLTNLDSIFESRDITLPTKIRVLYMLILLPTNPWVGKILWKRKWLPTPVFLPWKSHGQKSLAGYRPWGDKRVRYDLATKTTTKWT